MTVYNVKSTETRLFTLTQNADLLGSLTYESWFSFKAKLNLADQVTFDIEPKGIWGTTIDVKQDERVLIDFKMNWKGEILLDQKVDIPDRYFIFKQRGLLQSTFVLLNTRKEELLVIEPDVSWTKWTLDYQVTASDQFEKLARKELLLLTVIHCANYYITMMTSAVAASQ